MKIYNKCVTKDLRGTTNSTILKTTPILYIVKCVFVYEAYFLKKKLNEKSTIMLSRSAC